MGITFKAGTYNILHSYNPSKIAENLKLMAGEGVDIFALQEVVMEEGKPFIGEVILKSLGSKWRIIDSLCDVVPGRKWGTAIVYNSSRFKLLSSKSILPKKMEHLSPVQFLLSVIIMGGKGIVYPRSFINAKLSIDNKILYFSSIHPDFFASSGYRINQLKFFLVEKFKTKQNEYEVICGDFNNIDLLGTKKEVAQIKNTLGEDFVDATDEIPWSVNIFNVSENHATPLFIMLKKIFPFKLHKKIDYIWTKNIEVLSSKSFDLTGSDHLPLVTYLRLNGSDE